MKSYVKLSENRPKRKTKKAVAEIIRMSTSQIINLVVIIAALGGSMTFSMMQTPDKPIAKKDAECTAVAAALPLVNITTGMGMTAAIAEC